MPFRKSRAQWEGGLREGKGHMSLGSGSFEGAYSFGTRFENGKGSNPEELIGAALAGCFSMALAGELERTGKAPRSVSTEAEVELRKTEAGFSISTITLTTEAEVPDMDQAAFQDIAEGARKNCPVSRALTGVEIKLNARLM